jgi:hypothetical protein
MGKTITRLIGGAILLLMIFVFAWITARKLDAYAWVIFFQQGMLYLLIGLGLVAAYSMAVGAYHTFLSVTGLDGGDGPEEEKQNDPENH